MKTKKLTIIILIIVALFLSACGPSAEQIATMTASAWTPTPSPTSTPTFTLTPSPTPSPTLTPTMTLTPTSIPLAQFEGMWKGPMSSGGTISIQVGDGKIVSFGIDFTQPGCETVTPFLVFMLNNAQPVENNSFGIEGFWGKLVGAFTLDELTGSLHFNVLTCQVETTFSAEK